MMTDLLMAFFLTRDEKYNPQHQQTGLLLFSGDRQRPRKGKLAQVICAVSFFTYAVSYVDNMTIRSCRIKSLI